VKRALAVLLLSLFASGLVSCNSDASAPASAYSSNVATRWFDLAHRLTRSEGLTPPVASRAFGYEGVALYEAVVPGMPSYQSLAAKVNGQLQIPDVEDGVDYHWPAVANAALATVMPAFYKRENSYLAISRLFDQVRTETKGKIDPEVLARSEEHGRAVGIAVIRWALGDGYESLRDCPFTPPAGAGLWAPTPPARAKPLEPCWGRLRPFVMGSTAAFLPSSPTPYGESKSSEFYRLAMEVFDTRNNLTDEQKEIALFWADDPGRSGTPPGHSVAIATQLLIEQNKSLDFSAETYARLGMAVADAFISCWDTKYVYNLVRPITYIQAVIDPDWTPLINTPPFPEYTSGHSVQTAAAAEVLTAMFGDIPVVDRTHEPRGLKPRSFRNFRELVEEAALSRLYAGIHYRPAIAVGVEQGSEIGRAVTALKLKD
jgi:hypothetical protein